MSVSICPKCGGAGRLINSDQSNPKLVGTFVHEMSGGHFLAVRVCPECMGNGFVAPVTLHNNQNAYAPAAAVALVYGGDYLILPEVDLKKYHSALYKRVNVSDMISASTPVIVVQLKGEEEDPILSTLKGLKTCVDDNESVNGDIEKIEVPDPCEIRDPRPRCLPVIDTGDIDWDDQEVKEIYEKSDTLHNLKGNLNEKYEDVPSVFVLRRQVKLRFGGPPQQSTGPSHPADIDQDAVTEERRPCVFRKLPRDFRGRVCWTPELIRLVEESINTRDLEDKLRERFGEDLPSYSSMSSVRSHYKFRRMYWRPGYRDRLDSTGRSDYPNKNGVPVHIPGILYVLCHTLSISETHTYLCQYYHSSTVPSVTALSGVKEDKMSRERVVRKSRSRKK